MTAIHASTAPLAGSQPFGYPSGLPGVYGGALPPPAVSSTLARIPGSPSRPALGHGGASAQSLGVRSAAEASGSGRISRGASYKDLNRHMFPEDEVALEQKGMRELKNKATLERRAFDREQRKQQQERERLVQEQLFQQKQELKEAQAAEMQRQRFLEIEQRKEEAERRRQERLSKREATDEATKKAIDNRAAEQAKANRELILSTRCTPGSPRGTSPRGSSPRGVLSPRSPRQSPSASWGLRPGGGDRIEEHEERQLLLRVKSEREVMLASEREARDKVRQAREIEQERLRVAQARQFDQMREEREQRMQEEAKKKGFTKEQIEEKRDKGRLQRAQIAEQEKRRETLAQRARERQAMQKEQLAEAKRKETIALKAEREAIFDDKRRLKNKERELSQKQALLQKASRELEEYGRRDHLDNKAEEMRVRQVLTMEERQLRSETENQRRSESKQEQDHAEKLQRGSVLRFDRPSPRDVKEARHYAQSAGIYANSPRMLAATLSHQSLPNPPPQTM